MLCIRHLVSHLTITIIVIDKCQKPYHVKLSLVTRLRDGHYFLHDA